MKMTAAIAGLAVMSAGAHAGVQTQTQTFFGVPNFTETLTFNQFNGDLADLVSIKVTFELGIGGGQIIMDNDGVKGGSGTGMLGAMGALSSADVSLLSGGFPMDLAMTLVNIDEQDVVLGGDNGDGPGLIDGTGSDGVTLHGDKAFDVSMGFIDPAAFGGYVGAGTFDIEAAVNTIFDVFGVGGVEGGFSPVDAMGEVTVEYRFVPTPASSTLIVGGLGLIARRRR